MRLVLGVLAILVSPVVVYAVGPQRESPLRTIAVAVYLTLALALLGLSFISRSPKRPDMSIDEATMDRRMNLTAVLGAAVIANYALLFAFPVTPYICGLAIVWTLFWLIPFTRRISVTTHILINRDVKSVFEFMADMRNQTQYTPEVVSVQKITDGDIGPGTQFRSTVQLDKTRTFEGVEEIVDMEWGHRITDRVANGTRPNHGVMTFDPVGPATQLTYQFVAEVSYASALLGAGALRWATTGEMRRRRMEAWARLKQVLEARPDA